jgi:hypothetical protein
LAGAPVSVAILRAKDQLGASVYRAGRLELAGTPDDVGRAAAAARAEPIARVLDGDGSPVVTFLGRDRFALWNGRVRAEFRTSFRVDLDDRPIPAPQSRGGAPVTFERAMRELAAELEAGFRSALLLRPDPDPDAGAGARAGNRPYESGPLSDGSVRFAVGHAAATLRPDGENGVRLTCIGSELWFGRQFTQTFEPLRGARYDLVSDEVERLGADVRAFLDNRRERFALIT